MLADVAYVFDEASPAPLDGTVLAQAIQHAQRDESLMQTSNFPLVRHMIENILWNL